jgi:hypothetical protein
MSNQNPHPLHVSLSQNIGGCGLAATTAMPHISIVEYYLSLTHRSNRQWAIDPKSTFCRVPLDTELEVSTARQRGDPTTIDADGQLDMTTKVAVREPPSIHEPWHIHPRNQR